jgi:hypothetical protein
MDDSYGTPKPLRNGFFLGLLRGVVPGCKLTAIPCTIFTSINNKLLLKPETENLLMKNKIEPLEVMVSVGQTSKADVLDHAAAPDPKPEPETEIPKLTLSQKIYATIFDTEEKPPRSAWLIICEDIPGINLVFDMVFDQDPKPDGLKDILNLIGLIDALILGFTLSLLTCIDYDEVVDADNRFLDPAAKDTPPGYAEYYDSNKWGDRSTPSASFSFYCYTSILLLFTSLISVLLIYLDFANKDFDANTKTHAKELFGDWWSYGKVTVFLCFLECVFGIFYATGSISYLLVIKYPDYYVENHGIPNFLSVNFPYGGYFLLTIPISLLMLLCAILLGLGTRRRYRRGRKIARYEKKELDNFKESEDYKKWKNMLDKDCRELIGGVVADELLNEIAIERIRFSNCKDMTGDHLLKLSINRLGHQLVILDACRKGESIS